MGTFVFGDGKDINRDSETNECKNPGCSDIEGSTSVTDIGRSIMDEIFNDPSDQKIDDPGKIFEAVNTSDSQPKFVNMLVPNPEYFKIGEAYKIHRNPGVSIPSIFGSYATPGGDWVGILVGIDNVEFIFSMYHSGLRRIVDEHVSLSDIGDGPGQIVIDRLSNVSDNTSLMGFNPLSTNSQNHYQKPAEFGQVETGFSLNDPRVHILNKTILSKAISSICFTDGTTLTLMRILNQHCLPSTVGGLVDHMLRMNDKNTFIEYSYGIGEKRMDEIISGLNNLGIQIDGYSID